ncbi:MAG TPA: PQQ-dependent sugar dehydrogenase [Actinomycetota bacterium]|nr:PQQ-dependent sugar dehydrogenase [Actinomycetota bacterium]
MPALLLAGTVTADAVPRIEAERIAGDLDQPVAFTFDPLGRIWYVEKATGEVRILDPADGSDTPFVTVPRVDGEGERGMLGIALDPGYPDRPLVYVYATRTVRGALRNQILRYRDLDGSGSRRRVIFSSRASSSPYHNGGRIAFGPDGLLYAIVGDAHDPSNSQDLSDDRGKILRLEPDGDVPRSAPFGNRVFAYGIRNSFGFAFDPSTGRLWETENGPACNDEVNRIKRGRNHGWGPSATCEGASPGNTNRDGPDPVRPRDHYVGPIGITGIAFCDGCRLGRRSEGAVFWGSVNEGTVTRAILNRRRTDIARRTVVYRHPAGTLSFEVGPAGRVYFSDFEAIYVLRRA